MLNSRYLKGRDGLRKVHWACVQGSPVFIYSFI